MTGKFKCIGGIDNKVSAIQTHKHNFKDSISICEDIRKVSPEDFEKLLKKKKVDLVLQFSIVSLFRNKQSTKNHLV